MNEFKPLPSQEYLRSCFRYDPATGRLTWLWRADIPARINNRLAGCDAGSSKTTRGRYVRVKLGQTHFAAHRIIFKMMTGRDPDVIDHINRDGTDNRWANMRESTMAQNACNRRTPDRPLPRGVTKYRGYPFYRADIQAEGINKYLGRYRTVAEADAAYRQAARSLHGPFNPSVAQ